MRRILTVVVVGLFGLAVLLDVLGVAPGAGVQALPLLVLLGAGYLLWGAVWPGQDATTETALDIPLDAARAARLDLHLGAGDLHLTGGAPATRLLTGTCVGTTRQQINRDAGTATIRLRQPFSLSSRGHADWQLALANGVPWSEVKLMIGASTASLDFTGLSVENLVLEVGGTTLDARLPAQGAASLEVSAGQSVLHVPAGVPARIDNEIRLGEVTIDPAAFRALDEAQTRWETPAAADAEPVLHLTLKGGLGSVTVVSD